MTFLCASIFVESVEQALRDGTLAAEHGAEMIEYRLDHVAQSIDPAFVARSPLPCVVTSRESESGDLLEKCLTAGAAYADVELDSKRFKPDRQIVSIHGWNGRPDRLYNIIAQMNALPVAVNKIAWSARSIRENIEVFELLIHRNRPTIALCMGEAGLMSRILAKKFGAFLTYASLRPTEVTAPGQPTIDELKQVYRWDAINPKTKVFGVVGSPISQSLSPAIHNAAFDATAFNGVYVPMLVEPSYESFKAFMASFTEFSPLDLGGLSITAPHKENALRYLNEIGAQIDSLATQIGAVNTILVSGGVQLRGFNTDHDALLESIPLSLEELSDKRIAVIGAGGMARTAVAAFANLGATVVVYNRTREKADALAKEFDGKTGRVVSARLEKLCDSCCHVFINCTSVGMSPAIDQSPLGDRLPSFTSNTLVIDTIYNPPRTKLLEQASKAGAKTVNGSALFLQQAAAQFELFTGLPARHDAMRRAFDERLIISL